MNDEMLAWDDAVIDPGVSAWDALDDSCVSLEEAGLEEPWSAHRFGDSCGVPQHVAEWSDGEDSRYDMEN